MLVTGEPRAGRSDLIEALRRVLDPEVTRSPPGEFDVFQPGPPGAGDADREPGLRWKPLRVPPASPAAAVPDIHQATIEITLGDLGDDLQQHFYRKLELWDRHAGQLITEAVPGEITRSGTSWSCVCATGCAGVPDEGTGDHWVDYPKTSVPADGVYDRARRADRMLLPFAVIIAGQAADAAAGRPFRAFWPTPAATWARPSTPCWRRSTPRLTA